MPIPDKKRKCGSLSYEDQLRLLQLIEKEKYVIENKITNKVANVEKDEAWRRILTSFNAGAIQHRNIEQIKSKYDNLKTKARKIVAEKKQYLKGTGGGPDLSDVFDPIIEAVLRIINMKTVVGLNANDCDNLELDNIPVILAPPENQSQNIQNFYTSGSGHSNIVEIMEIGHACSAESGSSNFQENTQLKSTGTLAGSTSQLESTRSTINNDTTSKKWSSYTPRKLKQPVSNKLRPTVLNPVILAKEEYYKKKAADVEVETWARREQNRRMEEEHQKKQRLLDLEIQIKEEELKNKTIL